MTDSGVKNTNSQQETLFNPETIDRLVNKVADFYGSSHQEHTASIKTLTKQLPDIQKKIDNILNAIANGMYPEFLKVKLADYEQRKAQIQSNIACLQNKMSTNTLDKKVMQKLIKREIRPLNSKSLDNLKPSKLI